MSRNDQVSRQWLLLQKLENTHGLTLAELASSLPPDYACHERTIRRDLEALQIVFPLVQEKNENRMVWKLMDGYRNLHPLTFSTTEVLALMFSRHLLKPLEGTSIKDSIDSAFNKMAAALAPEALCYVQHLQEKYTVRTGPYKVYAHHHNTIEQIDRAISRQHTLHMSYYSASRDETSNRNLDPYRLWYASGALYLVGFCHQHREVRLFAVDRIRSLEVTRQPFTIHPDFNFDVYVRDALMTMRGKPIRVELLFTREAALWVRDHVWHESQRFTSRRDGRLLMSLQVSDTPELVGWILHFAAEVEVLQPVALKEKVRSEAQRIHSLYKE